MRVSTSDEKRIAAVVRTTDTKTVRTIDKIAFNSLSPLRSAIA